MTKDEFVKSFNTAFGIFFCVCLLCFNSLEAKARICLNMIVKNENHVIKEGLNSVKPIIDYWVIVDTGSTDGTQETIKETMKGIPGELFERPWVNFAHNRNEALQLAKDKADYLLFLDADDTLSFSTDFQMPLFNCDAYEIKWIHKNGVYYYKPQLIRASLPWEWKGVIHEYLSCPSYTTTRLNGVENKYGACGARSQDPEKYAKAVKILEEALVQEPNNERYVFYLAESLRDAGRTEEAIVQYERRASLGEWNEEVYWALLQAAVLKEQLGKDDEVVIESYHRAHRARPHRAEPIYCLAALYNRQQKYQLAYACIKGWETIPQPDVHRDILFKVDWIEQWGLKMELSLAAYYLGKKTEFLALCDQLLMIDNLPEETRNRVLANKNIATRDQLPGCPTDLQNPDSLRACSQYYRDNKLYQIAYEFSKRAMQLSSPPTNELLFEHALNTHNIGNFEEAVAIITQLLTLNTWDEVTRHHLNRNLKCFESGIYTFAHAKKHWGSPPWEKGSAPAAAKPFSPPASKKSRLHICSMASDYTPMLQQLETSCAHYGHHLEILGLQEPFSLGKKLRDYKKYIDTLPDNDVVMCIDGYDVLVLADEKTILERFMSLGAPVVFSAETTCFPYPHLADHIPKVDTKFTYLNSGSFIGYVGPLKKIFATFGKVPDEVDDQGMLTLYSLYHKDAIQLDYGAEVFLTLWEVPPQDIQLDVEKKKVVYTPFSKSPCVVHGNAAGKVLYQEIYNQLFK